MTHFSGKLRIIGINPPEEAGNCVRDATSSGVCSWHIVEGTSTCNLVLRSTWYIHLVIFQERLILVWLEEAWSGIWTE